MAARGVVQVCLSSNLLHSFPGTCPAKHRGSAQTGGVVGYGSNIAIGHAVGNVEHFRAVGAVAAAEQAQLLGDVVGMLAADTRILARYACTVRCVTACTGRNAARSKIGRASCRERR